LVVSLVVTFLLKVVTPFFKKTLINSCLQAFNQFLHILQNHAISSKITPKNKIMLQKHATQIFSIPYKISLPTYNHFAKKCNSLIKTIKRPPELASDTAKTVDVVNHVIENIDKEYDFIVLLQPTSPLRTSNHIDEAIEQLIKLNADAIISVTEVDHSPLWCNILPESLSMENFISENIKHKRSQDLPKFYRLNGAIYICKTKKFIEEDTFFLQENVYAYIMDKKSSIDIDEELNFKLAEIILKEKFLK
jgi:CMP-N,N'-diacetyllegionaminic acid synthase